MQVLRGRGVAGAVRAFVAGSFVIGAATALAGCSGSGSGGPGAGGPSGAGSTAAVSAGAPSPASSAPDDASPPVSGDDEGRLVSATRPVRSPSGTFVAALVPAAVRGGVQTYAVVVRDAAGRQVFSDTASYTDDQGLAVAWLSTKDQLWLQSESATSHVDPSATGWHRTDITPATVGTIPAEIKALTD